MKIWFDILTPKQLLFFEPFIKKLEKKHRILCTSREYPEVTKLAKIRRFNLKIVGRHGGAKKNEKLDASIRRIQLLSRIINRFSPDLTISFCSPEASRVSFGLGIKHIAFSDSPHANAVMRLSIPLIQKLLIPWIIPKREFEKFGINSSDIITYRAIDAAILSKRKLPRRKLPFKKDDKKTILFRLEEEKAAYSQNTNFSIPLIQELVKKFQNENILVLCRYESQIKKLRKIFGKKIKPIPMTYDGKQLLLDSDIFVGSGGTMTAESAFLGIPTISYNAVPNLVEDYLVRSGLVIREGKPKKIVQAVKKQLEGNRKKIVAHILRNVEDPYPKLIQAINEIT